MYFGSFRATSCSLDNKRHSASLTNEMGARQEAGVVSSLLIVINSLCLLRDPVTSLLLVNTGLDILDHIF